jgi:Tudor domain
MSLENFHFDSAPVDSKPAEIDSTSLKCAVLSLSSSNELTTAIEKKVASCLESSELLNSSSKESSYQKLVETANELIQLNQLLHEELTSTLCHLQKDDSLDNSESSIQSLPQYLDEPLINKDVTFFPQPAVIELRKNLKIKVTEIVSPSEFWFQYNGELHHDIMNQLQAFYSTREHGELQIHAESMLYFKGMIVAAELNGIWHRARIVYSKGDQIEVFFIDYGKTKTVHMSKLRYLLQHFASYSPQVVEGCMSAIKPLERSSWSYDAIQSFYKKVANKHINAIAKKLVQVGVFEVDLIVKDCDSNGEEIKSAS